MSSRRARAGARAGARGSAGSSTTPDALPPNVRDALRRLSGEVKALFSSRLQPEHGGDGGSPLARLRTAELEAIWHHTSAVRDFLVSAKGLPWASSAVLDHASARQALLCLLAASLRLRRHELGGEGGRKQELRAKIAADIAVILSCALLLASAPTDHPGRSLRLPLLRSDALHAAGRQLAELVEPLEARAAEAAAGAVDTVDTVVLGSAAAVLAGQGSVGRPTVAEGHSTLAEPAAAYAGTLLSLVYMIIIAASDIDMVSGATEALEVRKELVAALEGSQVLEHAGRALMLLRLHVRGTRLARLLVQGTFEASRAHQGLWQLHRFYRKQADGQDASARVGSGLLAARLRAVASGCCAQYAALCLGLAVLCNADGCLAYGMPPALLAVLPTEAENNALDTITFSTLAARQLRAMLAMLRLRLGAAASPPGRRGALALAMRVGWLAVASARALATGADGGSGSTARGGNGGADLEAPRRVLQAPEVFPVAATALHGARRYLLLFTRPEADGAVAEAAGWWRLAAALAAHVLPHAGPAAELAAFGDLLAVSVWDPEVDAAVPVLPLPPDAPPVLAAAVDGGLLCCLELLMRRAGRAPDGPEAAVVRTLVSYRVGGSGFMNSFPKLLAYGKPRQAAALVATLRKLLRTAGPQTTPADTAPKPTVHQRFALACESILNAAVSWDCANLLQAKVPDQEEGGGLAPGGGPSPASQQLIRLLSCAACELLPELSQTLRASRRRSLNTLYTMVSWLPLLAVRCTSKPCNSAEAASSPTESGIAAAGDGGWRALLLEEVGAVPLLDGALHLARQWNELQQASTEDFVCRLVDACCFVAAVYAAPGPAPAHAAVGRSEAANNWAAAATMGALGESFRDAVTASTSVATAMPPLPWRPELLRDAEAHLRARGEQELASDAESLAAYLEAGGRGACAALRRRRLSEPGPLASALLPPAEARRLLPGRCANPTCANLDGDREADLALKACAGCGAVDYCCRPCQTAHWRAGHKELCGWMRGGGA
ncbi:hypothetical protein GPECTOR_1g526 [Gonium pectorale]|uniref:phytol kinase n=1 Tax=Gonium pectorale TaxID=33097 RepID=A0A150H3H8_GONPE|nr:hypothetical protein GPECTOR_1g526 [Gonium pectorale]|eukprot:KXZ56585.1 hypothetical protein GPECTOR_1g526 [Gonium pectorale]